MFLSTLLCVTAALTVTAAPQSSDSSNYDKDQTARNVAIAAGAVVGGSAVIGAGIAGVHHWRKKDRQKTASSAVDQEQDQISRRLKSKIEKLTTQADLLALLESHPKEATSILNSKIPSLNALLPTTSTDLMSLLESHPKLWNPIWNSRNPALDSLLPTTTADLVKILDDHPKLLNLILNSGNPSLYALIPGVIIDCIENKKTNRLNQILAHSKTFDLSHPLASILNTPDLEMIVKHAIYPNGAHFNPGSYDTQEVFLKWVQSKNALDTIQDELLEHHAGYYAKIHSNSNSYSMFESYLEAAVGSGHKSAVENFLSDQLPDSLRGRDSSYVVIPYIEIAIIRNDLQMFKVLASHVTGEQVQFMDKNHKALLYVLADQFEDKKLHESVVKKFFPNGITVNPNNLLTSAKHWLTENPPGQSLSRSEENILRYGDETFLNGLVTKGVLELKLTNLVKFTKDVDSVIRRIRASKDLTQKELIDIASIAVRTSRVKVLKEACERLSNLNRHWNHDEILSRGLGSSLSPSIWNHDRGLSLGLKNSLSPATLDYLFHSLKFSRKTLLSTPGLHYLTNAAAVKQLLSMSPPLTRNEYFELLKELFAIDLRLFFYRDLIFYLTEKRVRSMIDARVMLHIASKGSHHVPVAGNQFAEPRFQPHTLRI